MNVDPHHHFLIAAFVATWVIHGTYLFILSRKSARIQREMERLKK
jgi:CcmD family protein